jgi:poly(A) polymerase
LTGAGYQVYFVGGCVRNALLGASVNDIDLSTNAHPRVVMDLAEAAGLHVVPTGIEHGTVTVISDGLPHEVTTFRRDVETDGRHAVVTFAQTIEEDARRRDFTMNALYAAPDGTVVDPLGGLPDLIERRVRFIEDAERRIREDYLRILRFFRFHAWYGNLDNGLDAEGLAACAALSEGLECLSKERITTEMLKLLAAQDPGPATASMFMAGCLHRILPGTDPKALPILLDQEQQAGVVPDPIRRLVVLGGGEVETQLRLSKAQARRVMVLRNCVSDMQGLAEIAYRHDAETALDVALLRAALFEILLSPDLQTQIDHGVNAIFPVKAADLMPTFQGPALGKKLRSLEDQWITSGFLLTKEALLR